MEKYRQNLLIQFQNATGHHTGFDSKDLSETEFMKWIKERNRIGEEYTSFIESEGVDLEDGALAEVGKSGLDSVVLPYKTKIITDVPDSFGDIDRTRLLSGELSIEKNGIYLLTKNRITLKPKKIAIPEIKTVMTQNPGDYRQINGWEYLHNHDLVRIIVGFYGKIYDKDLEYKIEMLKRLKKFLKDGSYKETCETNQDNYFYMIKSDYKNDMINLYDDKLLYGNQPDQYLQSFYFEEYNQNLGSKNL